MKAKVGKTSVSAKAQSKPAKTVAAANSAKKAAVKSVKKSPVKPGAPSTGKIDARASAQASHKPGVKATTKAIVKPVAKPSVKGVKLGVLKAPLKPAVTIQNLKSTPKAAAKKVNPALQPPPKSAAETAAKTTAKPAAKPAAKAAAKPVSKPADKKELKAKPAKASVAPVAKGKTDAKAVEVATAGKPIAKLVAKPVVKPVVKAVSAPTAVLAVSSVSNATMVPPKAGRPSSRLAQLTVPSMAQSVASTAAKSSFTQSTALPLIVPPLPSATKKDPKLANNWKTKPVEQLTDAELLSMPDSEYMNDKQMGVFRLKLSILKQDILNSASDTTEHLREDTVVVPDPADRATIEEEHALELRTRDRERKLLKKIEQSINRIDAGDYGYCDETGEPIGVGRLLARPTAMLSLEAQQRRELKQKMFGD